MIAAYERKIVTLEHELVMAETIETSLRPQQTFDNLFERAIGSLARS